MNDFPKDYGPSVNHPITITPAFDPVVRKEYGTGEPFMARTVTFTPKVYAFTLRVPEAYVATLQAFYAANETAVFWFWWEPDQLWYQAVFADVLSPNFLSPGWWDVGVVIRQYNATGSEDSGSW